jgi:hypothetical protein
MIKCPAVFLSVSLVGVLACTDEGPPYDLLVRLEAADAGGLSESRLSQGTSSLKTFPCDVSIRLGECADARPVQLFLIPAAKGASGTTDCASTGNTRKILLENIGRTVPLGRADAGLLWIQAFHGDDDDDSGLVDRAEMNAYAELVTGTLSVSAFNDDRLEGAVDARSASGNSHVQGTLGALNNDSGARLGVGPRCTWPIGAQAGHSTADAGSN